MPLGAHKAAMMGTAGVSTGDVVLISSQTATNSASLTFSSGITSTYGEYIFKFYNLHPSADGPHLTFQVNASGESGYNETMTTTKFAADHKEDDSQNHFQYHSGEDQAEGTAFQNISQSTGYDNDQNLAGELHLFNPSSTTYVTHFYSKCTNANKTDYVYNDFTAGYINTTAAITGVQFKFASGNIDAGKIKMWGVK